MRFDRFEIDSRQRVLLRDGKIVRLTPKAFDLLELLVSRANEVVPKSELVERLWPDTVVSDASLSKLVFIVRKELAVTSKPSPSAATASLVYDKLSACRIKRPKPHDKLRACRTPC